MTYPATATATRLSGYAFDACAAPPLTAMQIWTSSPYDGVGVYVGGVNRSCSQPNLTAAWVTAVSLQGWRIIPIYVGHQAPCTARPRAIEFTTTTAASLGAADAADAVLQAQALGMLPGSAIYGDMEHYYSLSDVACRTAVLGYVSAWTKELHRLGYLSGMYANLTSGAKHLSEAYISPAYARPDAIWIARWDANTTLTRWAGIPNAQWSNHQRGKQYQGDHDETYGGVKINIDSDRFDAPVATVSYPYQVTSTVRLNGRSGPTTSAPPVAGELRGRRDGAGGLPGRWSQGRNYLGVEQAGRWQLRHRQLPQHALEDHLQPSAATLHLPLPGHRANAEPAHRSGCSLSHIWHSLQRGPGLGDLPALGLQGRNDVGLGQAGRRHVPHRLLSGDAQQDDLQPAPPPLLTCTEWGAYRTPEATPPHLVGLRAISRCGGVQVNGRS